jgi:RluA family pseudouridine synthase
MMPQPPPTAAQANFKAPPRKYQPRGLKILFEDRDIVVVDKESGLLTIGSEREREKTAYFRLNEYVRKGVHKSTNRIFIVHRLDRETSGVLIFAKNERAKRHLQDAWSTFTKRYSAVVRGHMEPKEGIVSSYLTENSTFRVYTTKDSHLGKLAKTEYRVAREGPNNSLLGITLHTGRKHQIRVHLADLGHPVLGDPKYGDQAKGVKRLALHAASLTITHPHSHQPMTFTARSPFMFKALLVS